MAREVDYTTVPLLATVLRLAPRCQLRTSLVNRDDQKLPLLAHELGLVPDVVVVGRIYRSVVDGH